MGDTDNLLSVLRSNKRTGGEVRGFEGASCACGTPTDKLSDATRVNFLHYLWPGPLGCFGNGAVFIGRMDYAKAQRREVAKGEGGKREA